MGGPAPELTPECFKSLLQLANGRLDVTLSVTDNDYHSTLITSKIHARNGCQAI